MTSCTSRTTWIAVAAFTLTACGATRVETLPEPGGHSLPTATSRSSTAAEDIAEVPFDGSLTAYVDHALVHSSRLAAAEADWRAAQAGARLAGSLPDPKFRYDELLEPIETRTGPQERRIGITQAFPWPGQLGAMERVAEQKALAGRERYLAEREDVIAAVKVAFHEYAYLGRQLTIRNDLLEILRGVDSVVQGRVRSGGSQADLLRLQVEIGRLEDDLASLEGQRAVLSAKLAAVSERPLMRGVLPIPIVGEPTPVRFDRAQLRAQVVESNPRLREVHARSEASREGERVARLQGRPGFSLGVTSMQTGDALNNSMAGSGDDPLMVSLSFSLPVWSGKNGARRDAARENARSARERASTAELNVLTELEGALFKIDDAVRRIRLYRDSLLPRAAEALDLTLSAYRTGSSTVLDLIDSERSLLEFQLSLWQACRDYSIGEAHIEHLVGKPLIRNSVMRAPVNTQPSIESEEEL
jgi:outer membrane protein, heavy metal efflux system